MIPPETVAIKPEAKKVTSQRSWVRRPRHKLAPRGLVSIRLSAPGASRHIDKWIRDRVVDWRDSCWTCRAARHSA